MFNRILFRQSRLLAGLSQMQMAVEIGVTQKTISQWESGKNSPSLVYKDVIHYYFAREIGKDVADKIAIGVDNGQYYKLMATTGVVAPPSRKIIMVTYESGGVRWFPHTTDTLNQIVIDFDLIEEVSIIEQGGEQ